MTFPGKENLIFFENLEKSQERLWNDSCDVGIILARQPKTKSAARENLMGLMETYAYKQERTADRRQSVTSIFIPFEFDEGCYVGVELHVAFSTIIDREYLHININRARRNHTEANVNGPLYKQKALGPEEDEFADATEYACSDDEEASYLAEQGRSNPNAWAEAAYDAKRFN
jgi:hypothetical protein